MEPGRLTKYRGWTIGIDTDEWIDDSPRDWSPEGIMICWHSRYNLGDKHDWKIEEFVEFINKENGVSIIALPLYLYDHSGITMSTSTHYPFDCPWDAGQVGWIYMDISEVKATHDWGYMTIARRQKVAEWLRWEVEVYDQYLRGDVYYFEIINPDGEQWNSCGGCYDDPENIMKLCEKDIDNEINQRSVKATARAIHTQREALLHTVR